MSSQLPHPGVYAAVLTPFATAGRPDTARFVAHAEALFAAGCDGLAPLGTTGEANSIGVADRVAFIEEIAERLPAERLIIGAGAPALADAMVLSRIATRAGAAILMLPPFYYKAPSEDGLYAFFARLVDGLGGLCPRILLYHFPQMSAVPITAHLIERLRRAYPGVFVGLKDSSGDFDNTREMITSFKNFRVYSGSETLLADNLEAGGAGCISASVNVTAMLAARVRDSAGRTECVSHQALASEARRRLEGYPMIPALKAIVAARLSDPAWLRVLPPFLPLTADQTAALFARMADIPEFADLGKLKPA
ncbi:MAG: dihydrodipicolinate synthase family protein [Hyphomicrobiales bacterium]|nr:dihydrodipicolinate synthase family protein [Hyphomicrobiales bacterium]